METGQQDDELSASSEDELACFEDDTNSFMQRKRDFVFSGIPPVVLNQDFVSVEGTGGAVWRPSILFSEFVCSVDGHHCLPLKGKSLLEISSGLGLAAIVAWHLGATPVVATDIDAADGPIPLLARNVAENCGRAAETMPSLRSNPVGQGSGDRERAAETREKGPRSTLSPTKGPSPPRVQSLRWGDGAQLEEALAPFDGFGPDLVLACDVVFDVSFLPALEETLAEACALPTRHGARPRLCISHQKRNRAREDSFFAGLAKRLGPGEWRMVHQRDELSVCIFTPL
eukprot:g14305.t1